MPSLTYAELAQALRIAPESANRLARRKRWPRVRGKQRYFRVAVGDDGYEGLAASASHRACA
jgi:hypothetical protein